MLLLEGWARDGLTDKQIAHNCGITEQTLNNWKKQFSSLFESLKKGKEVVDIEVENALLNNARGYYYTEQVVSTKREVIYKDGKRVKEVSEPVLVDVKRWKPAETIADIYWLKNRKRDTWKDKPEEMATSEAVTIVDDL